MGMFLSTDITVCDTTVEDVSLLWAVRPPRDRRIGEPRPRPKDQAEGWAIDVPSVLALVEAIERAGGEPGMLREALLDCITQLLPHGCCPDCESALPSYEKALAAYEEATADLAERQAGMTGDTHPFIVTRSSAVHLWKCPAAPTEELFHPGATLEEFVHGKLVDGRVEVRPGYQGEPTNGARRMTGDELAEWIRSVRGPKGGANYRRCGRCQPALPVAYMSQAQDAYLND
ncbi:hypothetical protein ACIBTV_20105 [Micromonospora sp. NPDC049366]|uniref:hypothetical protein n=1 Tax=Micromonospora sp. NPDC049366 TaxID=3364271 RepID=UPI0037B8748C